MRQRRYRRTRRGGARRARFSSAASMDAARHMPIMHHAKLLHGTSRPPDASMHRAERPHASGEAAARGRPLGKRGQFRRGAASFLKNHHGALGFCGHSECGHRMETQFISPISSMGGAVASAGVAE
eukprot:ctg_3015.g406